MSEEDLTQEELQKLAKSFKELGVKPKLKSGEELKSWLISYANWAAPRTLQMDMPQDNDASSSPKETTSYTTNTPKLPFFSGDKKGETSYDLWRYEVECLIRDGVKTSAVLQSIRRSLRGNAARVLMRLGTEASIDEILQRFDSVYGIVDDNENLLSQFYSASQKENEDVSEWSCRLEDLLNKVIQNGEIVPTNTDQMLRNMFWNGLAENLKDITGHIFKECIDFDELRKAIRKVEQDKIRHKDASKKATIHQTVTSDSKMDELKAMIQKMDTKVNQMKEDIDVVRQKYQTEKPHNSRFQGQGGYFQDQQYQGNYRNRGKDYPQERRNEGEVVCYRCGQVGHIQYGCRVRLDHKRDLNSQQPASRRGR